MNPPTTPQNPQGPSDDLESYHKIAETVGGVPSLRGKDYVIQGSAAGVGLIIGGGVGLALAPSNKWPLELAAGLGAFGGLVAGVFASGIYLMIMGWIRHAK